MKPSPTSIGPSHSAEASHSSNHAQWSGCLDRQGQRKFSERGQGLNAAVVSRVLFGAHVLKAAFAVPDSKDSWGPCYFSGPLSKRAGLWDGGWWPHGRVAS